MGKPFNVLLITADHARHDAIGCNLDAGLSSSLARVVKTPNLSATAR